MDTKVKWAAGIGLACLAVYAYVKNKNHWLGICKMQHIETLKGDSPDQVVFVVKPTSPNFYIFRQRNGQDVREIPYSKKRLNYFNKYVIHRSELNGSMVTPGGDVFLTIDDLQMGDDGLIRVKARNVKTFPNGNGTIDLGSLGNFSFYFDKGIQNSDQEANTYAVSQINSVISQSITDYFNKKATGSCVQSVDIKCKKINVKDIAQECAINAKSTAVASMKGSQDVQDIIKNQMQSIAKETSQNVSFAVGDRIANAYMSSATNLGTYIANSATTNCMDSYVINQSVRISDCDTANVEYITQNALIDAVSSCVAKDVANQQVMQDYTQNLVAMATATEQDVLMGSLASCASVIGLLLAAYFLFNMDGDDSKGGEPGGDKGMGVRTQIVLSCSVLVVLSSIAGGLYYKFK